MINYDLNLKSAIDRLRADKDFRYFKTGLAFLI